MHSLIPRMDDWSRRCFVTRAAQAFLGVGLAPALGGVLPPWAAAAELPGGAAVRKATAKHVITADFSGYFLSFLQKALPLGTHLEQQGPAHAICALTKSGFPPWSYSTAHFPAPHRSGSSRNRCTTNRIARSHP